MMNNSIGALNETSLHAAIKLLYARPGDIIEAKLDNSVIDIVRGNVLIEIQTGNFSALKLKLTRYLDTHPVRVVYPLVMRRKIMRIANDGTLMSSRLSPKSGRIEDIFDEVINITSFLSSPNFTLDVQFVEEEVEWVNDGKGSWRRKNWSVRDRRLVQIMGSRFFNTARDYGQLLPDRLGKTFTRNDLMASSGMRKTLAQKMLYCLRVMGIIRVIGKNGRLNLYELA